MENKETVHYIMIWVAIVLAFSIDIDLGDWYGYVAVLVISGISTFVIYILTLDIIDVSDKETQLQQDVKEQLQEETKQEEIIITNPNEVKE